MYARSTRSPSVSYAEEGLSGVGIEFEITREGVPYVAEIEPNGPAELSRCVYVCIVCVCMCGRLHVYVVMYVCVYSCVCMH
jgi:hypothetical protein